jgi:histidinol-phosphatase (PHP family)
VVGHIDLVRKFEPAGFAFSKRVMTRVGQALQVVRDTGAVLDVNCGAWWRGYGQSIHCRRSFAWRTG